MLPSLFAHEAGKIARVALPVPIDELFEYSIPAEWERLALPGCRAQVRFRDRPLTGVIVELADEQQFRGRLLPIESIVDSEPALSEAMLELLRAAAHEMLCPVGIALATALPAGSTPRIARGYAMTPRGRAALEAGALSASAQALLESTAGQSRTESYLAKRGSQRMLGELERDGFLVRTGVEQLPAARVKTVRTARITPGTDTAQALETLRRAPQQAALFRHLMRHLAESEELPTASLSAEFPGAANLLRRLVARGWVELGERRAYRDVLGVPLEPDRQVSLTAEQEVALKPIVDAVVAKRFETFLLHGVTGSGKTEIYLQAIGEALRAGRQALVLVPEITLTHQILARIRGRFGDGLAVLHSGLRPGERLEQWQRLKAGATPIAVGARSALFAPLENLGVIVIDEEHDTAYKNEEGFRYHARDLAAQRGAQAGCPLILGSATPALETRFAADRGPIRRLVLASRIGGRPLPAVSIVDLTRERQRAPRGRMIILSSALKRAISQTLADGGQSILFLNRRGFSTSILCFECGAAERCPNCDISLVYHANDRRTRCHYCDYETPPPEHCSGCGAPDTALLGVGTERLEEEVRSHYPQARIARLDRDTAKRRGYTEGVLAGLRSRTIDILIGTQMVAKGHDFPGVRLVGVVVADVGLHLPDFRAAERTFQLLTQVAGRAGRDLAPGRVIIQTFAPDHYAIAPVIKHDYEKFYAEELGHRSALGYPPFGRLVRALVSGLDEAETLRAATELADAVRHVQPVSEESSFETLGPAPAPLARLRGRYRYQLLIKGSCDATLREAAEKLVEAAARLASPLQASVDVNPLSML